MRFGSVCSGIEAASVAWHPLGWQAAWLSEIEPFPSAVLAHHYPDVPNLGDMTKLPGLIESGEVEAPDLFCGGTPCQAFSVAGLRNSLDDDRGNLSLTFCEIADAIDSARLVRGERPCIVFWENVPGVLSTKDNAFGCFLAGLAGEELPLLPAGGKWTNAGCVLGPKRAVAWRVLDAQYFGVAQRRKRVFVVASARDGFNPAEILFEFQGVRRDTAPSREAGQKVAPTVTNGAPFSRTGNERVETEAIVAMANGQGKAEIDLNRSPTLTCVHEAPIVHYRKSRRAQSDTDHETWVEDDVSNTLNCFDVGDIRSTDVVAQPVLMREAYLAPQPMPINTMVALRHEALGEGTGFGIGEAGDPAYTLTKGHSHAVAQPIAFGAQMSNPQTDVDLAQTLQAKNPAAVAHTLRGDGFDASEDGTGRGTPIVPVAMQVRRLTPVECERLQGFPDGYTNIPWRGKPESPDGPRYKALGNSWAVPVVRWIGKRIQEISE